MSKLLKTLLSVSALAISSIALAQPQKANYVASAVKAAMKAPAAPVVPPAINARAASRSTTTTATHIRRGRSVIALSTAYNSLPNQTDSTPFITATGTRTRPGVVAMSRDMLRIFPYGTRVMIEDLSGRYNFKGRVFVVEDTMHARKVKQVDVWMASYRSAINYGRRTVRITAIR